MRCGFCGHSMAGNWVSKHSFCGFCRAGYTNNTLTKYTGKENIWKSIPAGCLMVIEWNTKEL
jgi:hypothetical protein